MSVGIQVKIREYIIEFIVLWGHVRYTLCQLTAETPGQPVSEWAAREQLDPGLLPPENLFFISLEYWDYMMQIVKDRKATIKEILLKTRECCNDPDPSARSLLMETVLTQYFQINKMDLSYLTEAQDSVDFVERMHD